MDTSILQTETRIVVGRGLNLLRQQGLTPLDAHSDIDFGFPVNVWPEDFADFVDASMLVERGHAQVSLV